MPSLLNIHDQKYDNSKSLEFTYRPINDKTKIIELNNMLLTTNWLTLSQTDVNLAFHEFQNKIEACLDIVAPLQHSIIPEHKVWREPWITKGLSNSMDKCTSLYKMSLKHNSTKIQEEKYKTYRNCLTKLNAQQRLNITYNVVTP